MQDSKNIYANVLEAIVITVPSNPTTGYSWCAVSPSQHLRVEQQDFLLDSLEIGSAGKQLFVLRVDCVGRFRLVLKLCRFGTSTPLEERIYDIETR